VSKLYKKYLIATTKLCQSCRKNTKLPQVVCVKAVKNLQVCYKLFAFTYFLYRLPDGRKGMMSVWSWAVAVWISSNQAQRPSPL